MNAEFQLDSLDRKILNILIRNARTPFLEIARECGVSGAAIHQRVHKMERSGIIQNATLLSPKALLNLCLHWDSNQSYYYCTRRGFRENKTNTRNRGMPSYYGKYSLLAKIYTRNNEHLKQIIVDKIQSIPEITFTETFISLEEGFMRSFIPEA